VGWKNLLSTSAQTVANAVAGSAATSSGVDSEWYRRLRKPAFQPPPAAFPIVWTLLYADIAVTSARVLGAQQEASPTHGSSGRGAAREARRDERGYRRALALNLALNAGWSWTFFAKRDTGLATLTAAALTVSSADLARRAGAVRPAYGAALAPYAAWCAFATALSGRIHQLNS